MNFMEYFEYRTYAYNRTKYPQIEVSRYSELFDNWKEYEEKYQTEKEEWRKKIFSWDFKNEDINE